MTKTYTPPEPTLFESVLYKARQFRERKTGLAEPFLKAYEALGRTTNTPARPDILKAIDLTHHLNRARPRKIVELGSGRTTFIIAAWAAKNGASHMTYEQDAEWAKAVNELCTEFGGQPVVHRELSGPRFAVDLLDDADFIYVDGPFVDGRADTFTGMPAYRDVPDHLRRGCRPATILITGRTDTVDAIREVAQDYRFAGGFEWGMQRRLHAHTIFLRRHSLFSLKRGPG